MGSIYTEKSKHDVIQEITKTEFCYDINTNLNFDKWDKSFSTRKRCIKMCIRGNILWTLEIIEKFNEEWTEQERYLFCNILKKDSNSWGYKSIDVQYHPYYYDCPLNMANMANYPASDMFNAWKTGVINYHKYNKINPFNNGDVLIFHNPIKYKNMSISEFICYDKKKYLFHAIINGIKLKLLFKLTKNHLKGDKFKIK